MPLTFDDDECYRLLLAMEVYLEDYAPATHGELDNMKKCEAVQFRLREHHDMQRKALGHSETFKAARERFLKQTEKS